jgi:hypothetical protein
MENFDAVFEKKVVCYGAGEYGKRAFRLFNNLEGAEICYFIESNHGKNEGEERDSYCGVPIVSPGELKNIYKPEELLIIITCNTSLDEEICEQITKEYPAVSEVVSWFGFYYAVILNIEDKRVHSAFREKYKLLYHSVRATKGVEGFAQAAYQLFNREVLLVYQPGKVGSSTVSASLGAAGKENIHIHYIKHATPMMYGYSETTVDIYKNFLEHIDEKNVKVISLVRDPIARSISSYFDGFQSNVAFWQNENRCTLEGIMNVIALEMNNGKYGAIDTWFREEFRGALGIDVFQCDFDREKGYGLINKGNVEVLLLTLEKLKNNEDIIGEFVGIPDFKLMSANRSKSKPCRHLYNEVMENVTIDREVLDFYYKNNPFVDFFYTEEQKELFRHRWE